MNNPGLASLKTDNEMGRRDFVKASVGSITAAALGPGIMVSTAVVGAPAVALQADRLSDHRYMANCFRLYLDCLAFNLLTRRPSVASPGGTVRKLSCPDAR